MMSPKFSASDEKFIAKLYQTLQIKPGGYVSTRDFLYDLYSFYNIDGEKIVKDAGYNNFAEFLKSEVMQPYVEFGYNIDGKMFYQARPNPRTEHIVYDQTKYAHGARENRITGNISTREQNDHGVHQKRGVTNGRFLGNDNDYENIPVNRTLKDPFLSKDIAAQNGIQARSSNVRPNEFQKPLMDSDDDTFANASKSKFRRAGEESENRDVENQGKKLNYEPIPAESKANNRNCASSSSKFAINHTVRAAAPENVKKPKQLKWDISSDEDDVASISNESLRSNNATTASGRIGASNGANATENAKIHYTQRDTGVYTDDEDSDAESYCGRLNPSQTTIKGTNVVESVTTTSKKADDDLNDDIFTSAANMKRFIKPADNAIKEPSFESQKSDQPNIDPKPIYASTSHGEKWLLQLKQQKQQTKEKANEKLVESDSTPVVSEYQMQRTQNNAAMVASKRETKHSLGLTKDSLEKLGEVIEAMVEYHSPRAVLLEDLMDALEKIEPRFLSLDEENNLSYPKFLREYCPNVDVFGKPKNPNLLWKESHD